MSRTRVLLADDHRIVLEGLKSLIEPEFEVAGTVADGRELLEQARLLKPDVLVVDISMPHLNGLDALRLLRDGGLKAPIIMLTMHQDPVYAAQAFDSGASGYVLKHAAHDELLMAIRESLKGHIFVSPMIAGGLMDSIKSSSHRQTDDLKALSPRQRELLQLLAEGKSAKEIATLLNISARTAEAHKYKLMEQLGAKTNAELILFAIKHGIISC